MDIGDLFVAVFVVLGIVFLIGLAIIGFLMWRYQIPPKGVVVMVVALGYLVSPVDFIPELVTGPLGAVDDVSVLTFAAVWVNRMVKARQMLRDAGIGQPGPPPS